MLRTMADRIVSALAASFSVSAPESPGSGARDELFAGTVSRAQASIEELGGSLHSSGRDFVRAVFGVAATPGDPQARCIRAGLAIVDAAMDPGSSGPEVVIVPRVGIDTGLVPTQGETAGQLLIGIGRMLAQVDALIESARQVEARTPPRSVCVRESTVLSVRGQFEFERLDAQAESSAPPTWLVRGEAESRTPTTEIVATEPAQPTEEVPTTRSPEIDRAGPPHVGLARKRRGVAVYATIRG